MARPTKLLAIDDSLTQCCYLNHLLPSERYELRLAGSLAEALHLTDSFNADLILVELLLYRSNGFEIGAQLIRRGFGRVALLSSRQQNTDLHWARALGILDIIPRPISAAELDSQIDNLLSFRGSMTPLDAGIGPESN